MSGGSCVTYFSGFCLEGEAELFADWLVRSDYTVAGFSYGAIRALEYALQSGRRIERLLLFSPAFFQTRGERYHSLQLRAFEKDPEVYVAKFLEHCAAPASRDLSCYRSEGSVEELRELLFYRWAPEKLRRVRERGTVIEVFVGDRDRIIDAEGAIAFFAPEVDALYRFRGAGHILEK
jgi:pimeloyl-ACP methyl ester carboxylesterase